MGNEGRSVDCHDKAGMDVSGTACCASEKQVVDDCGNAGLERNGLLNWGRASRRSVGQE